MVCIIRSMSRRSPTITDVARLCNVTPATVSRVLNGKTNFSTSATVREKILKTVRDLGYVPDLTARNLRSQKTRMIGIFVSTEAAVSGGVNESLIAGISSVLHPAGYDLFLELSSPDKPLKSLPGWRFDGGIVLQSPKLSMIEELDQRRVPYVCVNEQIGSPAATILADDSAGMRLAVEHLQSLGHRKLAYADAPENYARHYSIAQRRETLLQSVAAGELELAHDEPLADARRFMQSAVVERKATAVIAYDHRLAVAIHSAAAAMKLIIPADFSLICFNDVFPCAQMHPPLTVVSVSGREMGRIGAEFLLKALKASEAVDHTEIRVPEQLVRRESTAEPHVS